MMLDTEIKSNMHREKVVWGKRHLIVSPVPENMKGSKIGSTAKFDYEGVRYRGVPVTYSDEDELWLCLSDAEYKFFSDEYYRVYGSK